VRQISFSASKKNVVRGIHCSQYGKLGEWVMCLFRILLVFCSDSWFLRSFFLFLYALHYQRQQWLALKGKLLTFVWT
jgi:hypothetical protein